MNITERRGGRKKAEKGHLTLKQQVFVDAYAGDIKEAAQKAKISYGYARRLVTKSNILKAIQNRQETEVRPKTIANRQQRQEFWTKVMYDKKRSMRDRLRASELLGKSEADFTVNVKAGGSVTINLVDE